MHEAKINPAGIGGTEILASQALWLLRHTPLPKPFDQPQHAHIPNFEDTVPLKIQAAVL